MFLTGKAHLTWAPGSLSGRGSPLQVLGVLDGLWQSDPLGLWKKQRHSPGNQPQSRFKQDRFNMEPLERDQPHLQTMTAN